MFPPIHNPTITLNTPPAAPHLAHAQVKVMIEQGKADAAFADRWGNTALDEARRVGAAPVVAYLEPLVSKAQVAATVGRWKAQRSREFLQVSWAGAPTRVAAGPKAQIRSDLWLCCTHELALVTALCCCCPTSKTCGVPGCALI